MRKLCKDPAVFEGSSVFKGDIGKQGLLEGLQRYRSVDAEVDPAGKGNAVAEYDPSLRRVWELCHLEQITNVQVRVRKCIAFWEHELEAPSPTLECIQVGYKLSFLSVPCTYCKSNPKSAVDNIECVTTSIPEV